MLINHYGGNMDWDSHNWYALRHRVDGGKFLFFMWDSEFVFIGNSDNRLQIRDAAPGQLFDRLTDNAEFRIKLADAIQKHMFHDGLLTPEKVIERWNARSDQITDAIVAESARWGDYRRDVDRRGGPFDLIERDVQWVAERERLLSDYFPQRTDTVLNQYRARGLFPAIAAPEFSQRGGTILDGQQVTLQAMEDAAIYYTLDGSDPRDADGDVAAGALQYTTAFSLSQAATVSVRARAADMEWSAIDRVHFLPNAVPASAESLRISEIHYNPGPPTLTEVAAGHRDKDDFEFIELVNVSEQRIDLSHVSLAFSIVEGESVGVKFDFAAGEIRQLDPGQSLLVVENRDAFVHRYSADLPIAGQWNGGLNNGGEQITLAADGVVLQQFSYSDRWDAATDGLGMSLEHVNPAQLALADWGLSSSWRASTIVGGTPGRNLVSPIPGDANGDGVFNSADFVLVFQAGEYEDGIRNNSTFREGDWNGDGDFDTLDFVVVFQMGHYESEVASQSMANGIAAAVDWLFLQEFSKSTSRALVP